MIAFEEAVEAKNKYRDVLGKPEWLRGIGIGRFKDGFCIRINVASQNNVSSIPTEFEGVPVEVVVIGNISIRNA